MTGPGCLGGFVLLRGARNLYPIVCLRVAVGVLAEEVVKVDAIDARIEITFGAERRERRTVAVDVADGVVVSWRDVGVNNSRSQLGQPRK